MDVIATGAIDGLAESQLPLAYQVVEPLTRYGQPVFARKAAVIALSKLADVAQQRTQAADLLTHLLRDSQFRVQMAVFEAIRLLNARHLAGPLAAITYRDGRARRASKETLRALQENEPHQKEMAHLREELETLKGETRTLRESVEALKARK